MKLNLVRIIWRALKNEKELMLYCLENYNNNNNKKKAFCNFPFCIWSNPESMNDIHGHLIVVMSHILFLSFAWMSAPQPLKQHPPLVNTKASTKITKQIHK